MRVISSARAASRIDGRQSAQSAPAALATAGRRAPTSPRTRLASVAMGYIVADLLFGRQRLAILDAEASTAIVSVVLALLLALAVDRTLRHAQSARLVSDRLDASADTR